MFKEMFTADEEGGFTADDGVSDEKPIHTLVLAEGFEQFLSVCYNK